VEGGSDTLAYLDVGEVVRVLEGDGDTYLATVERVQGLLVYLRVDLDSWSPAIENVRDRSLYEAEFGPVVSDPNTVPAVAVPA